MIIITKYMQGKAQGGPLLEACIGSFSARDVKPEARNSRWGLVDWGVRRCVCVCGYVYMSWAR